MIGAIGPWAGGMLADRLGRSTAILIVMGISVPLGFIFGWFVTLPLPLVFLFGVVYGLALMTETGVFKAGLTDLVPAEIRSTALSLQSAFGFGISIVSPAVFGLVLDATNTPGVSPAI